MNKTLKAILTFVGVTPACAAVSSLVTSLLEKIPFMEEFTKPFTWILAVALGACGAYMTYKEKPKKQ
jgi:hypothetical protein